MNARIYHEYSELDKRMEYFIDSDDNWIWFDLGKHFGNLELSIYPYLPTWRPNMRLLTIKGPSPKSVSKKICKKIGGWYKKDLHR